MRTWRPRHRDPSPVFPTSTSTLLPFVGRQAAAVTSIPVVERARQSLIAVPGATGRLELDVTTHGQREAILEIVVRAETVEIWFAHRCCAVIDRTALRAHLAPQATRRDLRSGDLAWVRTKDWAGIEIPPGTPPLRLPGDLVEDLQALL